MALALADEVADGAVDQHDLKGRDQPAAHRRDELLGNDRLEHHRELDPHLLLLVAGEDVDDAVDRLGGPDGVQGREDELPGLGSGQRRLDGLEIPHLAQQNDVRRLPQRRAQGLGVAQSVVGDLALAHDALVVGVEELDRVLDGDDVALSGLVNPVDDTGEGGRLAAPRRAGDEDKALLFAGKIDDRLRDVEAPVVGQVKIDRPQDGRQRVALLVGVAAEPPQPLDGEGKVVVAGFLEGVHPADPLQLVDLPDQAGRRFGHQPLVVDRLDDVADLEGHRKAGNDKNIGRLPLNGEAERFFHICHAAFSLQFIVRPRRLSLLPPRRCCPPSGGWSPRIPHP